MNLKHNVSEIKRLLQEKKETNLAFSRFLISKGLTPSIVDQILYELKSEEKNMGMIKAKVAAKIHVTGELSFKKMHKLVFVGPTGVGKTTTIFKLAIHYIQKQKNLALMTLDEAKKEVFAQWAEKLQIPIADSLDTNFDLLLIDTEGCNFYLPNRVDILGEKIAEMGEGIETLLTLSAAAKEVDLYGAVHQFSSLCPSSLTFTKLDETLASGVLVNVLAKSNIPLRYIAYGYPLPGQVELADSLSITHKILTDFNKQEFQFIRQLTLSTLN